MRLARVLCCVAVVLFHGITAHADVPSLINYQGILESGGVPVTTTVSVVFNLWNNSVGGASFWSETQNVTPDADGLFSVSLGSVASIPDSIFWGTNVYLGVTVGADPEMTPRQRLVSTGYAFSDAWGRSKTARGAEATVGGGTDNTASGNYASVGGGIGNTASGLLATVAGGSANSASGAYSFAAGLRAKANHAGTFVWGDQTFSDFTSTATNQFLIRAGNGVGINHNSPTHPLDVNGFTRFRTNSNTNLLIRDQAGQIDNVALDFITETNDAESSARIAFDGFSDQATHRAHMRFYTRTTGDAAPVERMTITETGLIGMGDVTPEEKLDVVGNVAVAGTICATGAITANSVACPSDARFKKDIMTLSGALGTIDKMRGVTYRWKSDEYAEREFPMGAQVGLIAQEVRDVVPQAVVEQKDGYLAVDYARLVPLLIEGMKEQQRQIDELRARLDRQSP
jgi:hypothetical protein